MENEYGLQGEVKLLTGGNAKLSTRKQCEARDPCASKADLVQVQSQRLQSGWKKTMNRIGHLAALVCHVKALERNVPGLFHNCKEKTLDSILRFVYDSRGEDNE